MQRLPNKISIITGAAQGIGLAAVIACDIRQAGVDEAVRQCQALGA